MDNNVLHFKGDPNTSEDILMSHGAFGAKQTLTGLSTINNVVTGQVSPKSFSGDQGSKLNLQPGGNGSEFLDASAGGNNQLSGQTAQLRFVRSRDRSKFFTFQKRVGYSNDRNEVLELFAEPSYTDGLNYIFIGRDGGFLSRNVNTIAFGFNVDTTKSYTLGHQAFEVGTSLNGVDSGTSTLFTGDARTIYGNDSKSGVISYLAGSGTDGIAMLQHLSYPGAIAPLYADAKRANVEAMLHLVGMTDAAAGTLVGTPTDGDIYFSTTTGTFKVRQGGAWKQLSTF